VAGIPIQPVLILAFALGFAAARWRAQRTRAGSTRADPDRERSDGELAVLRRELEDMRGELGEIHSSVSHDLRSPIGAALNFLSVLEEDHGAQLDADGRMILARVRRSAESALTLLDGLARLARVGRKAMEPRRVDVDALVRAAFAAARPADRAVELTVVEPLPPVVGGVALAAGIALVLADRKKR